MTAFRDLTLLQPARQLIFVVSGGEAAMSKFGEDWRMDFEQALGETFGPRVSPPVPFEDASPHECCEVVWLVAGQDVTPARLAALSEPEVATLARKFGEYFECNAPSVQQIRDAIADTLARWPVGSLDETT
jgi:hypothetical protein